MTHLHAQATITVENAAHVLTQTFEHLVEHDAVVSLGNAKASARFRNGQVFMTLAAGSMELVARADTLDDLAEIKAALASHVFEFAPSPGPSIVWTGDGAGMIHPPGFRIMTVAAATTISPRMRRVTLRGENLGRYASPRDLHVKLLLPPSAQAPVWPSLKPDGTVAWPEGDDRLAVRKYTIRRIDLGRGEIDIDFVLHDHAGPGSRFGATCQPGERIGMFGPGGRSIAPDADYYVLAGDETALPAIARISEMLPEGARGVALVEVEDVTDEMALKAPPGFAVEWLHRRAGRNLTQRFENLQLPENAPVFIWAAAEFDSFRTMRRHVRSTLAQPREKHLVVSYWRHGIEGP